MHLPFSVIFESVETTVAYVLGLFKQRQMLLMEDDRFRDDAKFINDGKNYPPILPDMFVEYQNKSEIIRVYFLKLFNEKCLDKLSAL